MTRKGHSLKSIPGGLKYFLCLGHHAFVITPATLGFYLIKTLASVPQGVKTSRAFQVCVSIWYLSPSPGLFLWLGGLQRHRKLIILRLQREGQTPAYLTVPLCASHATGASPVLHSLTHLHSLYNQTCPKAHVEDSCFWHASHESASQSSRFPPSSITI